MIRKATARIVTAFLARTSAQDVRLFTDGEILRSYALEIARFRDPRTIAILDDKTRNGCSATTRTHIDAVRDLAERAGFKVVDLAAPAGAYLGPQRGENAPRL